MGHPHHDSGRTLGGANETIRAEHVGRAGGCPDLVRDDSFYHVGGGTMKKYNTRPADFAGCHPVIAEHLKRGEAIECRVGESDKGCHKNKFVIRYRAELTCPYETYDWFYKHAEPIPLKVKRIMPPERAIPVLIAEGWKFTSAGYLTSPSCVLVPKMYALMGEDLDGEASEFAWPPCIIEEVEDDDE